MFRGDIFNGEEILALPSSMCVGGGRKRGSLNCRHRFDKEET
jgi:hypothetical protein